MTCCSKTLISRVVVGDILQRVFCRALQAEQNPHRGEQNAHRGERGTVRGGYIGLKGCREALRGEC